jgi:hypothetical protein
MVANRPIAQKSTTAVRSGLPSSATNQDHGVAFLVRTSDKLDMTNSPSESEKITNVKAYDSPAKQNVTANTDWCKCGPQYGCSASIEHRTAVKTSLALLGSCHTRDQARRIVAASSAE